MPVCETCGSRLAPDADFCSQCGTPVRRDAREAAGAVDDGTVSVINGTEVVGTVYVGGNPIAAAVGADGGPVYVTNLNQTVAVIESTELTATIPVGVQPAIGKVASDGTLYLPNSEDGTVMVLR